LTTNVRVIPSQANRIRAARQANPDLSPLEIAQAVGLKKRVVDIALGKGDTLRRKSVSK
jgi:hypothetical protein